MRRNDQNVKWTRGKSTVERVTKGTKTNLAMRQKALHLPLKLLNSLLLKKS